MQPTNPAFIIPNLKAAPDGLFVAQNALQPAWQRGQRFVWGRVSE